MYQTSTLLGGESAYFKEETGVKYPLVGDVARKHETGNGKEELEGIKTHIDRPHLL